MIRRLRLGHWADGWRIDLVMRYAQLHAAPTEHIREFAVRWPAFPIREDHQRVVGAEGQV